MKKTKEKQTKSNANKGKEIIKIRVKLNDIENRKTIKKNQKTKSQFFEKINKVDKTLTKMTTKKREKTQITQLRNEIGDITTFT